MPNSPSPVTPAEIQNTIPDSTGSICTKLTSLWSLSNLMFEFFDWFLNDDGTISDEGIDFLSPASVPTGSMVHWPLDVAPDGWVTANGAVVSRTGLYENLFNLYGTKYGAGDGTTTFGLPDCRRRFLFGASGTNVAGSTGGAESATIAIANLPAHTHGLNEDVVTALIGNPVDAAATATVSPGAVYTGLSDSDGDILAEVGGDEDLDILNPYFSAHIIIKL